MLKITAFGEVTISFSEAVNNLFKTATAENLNLILSPSSSNLNAEDTSENNYNFTWNTLDKTTPSLLFLQLNFSSPSSISKGDLQDLLQISILKPENFISTSSNQILSTSYFEKGLPR